MKKTILISVLVLCFLFAGTAFAKDVYYETFTDSTTGRTINYFDLGENTPRMYFTQNYWLKNNNSMIVASEKEFKAYKYNLLDHTAEVLFDDMSLGCYDFTVANDVVYARCTDGSFLSQDLKDNGAPASGTRGGTRSAGEELVKLFDMTLPLNEANQYDGDGGNYNGVDYTVGGLTFRLCNANRWRNSQTLTYTRGGALCRATVSQARSEGNGWDPYVRWVSGRNGSRMQFRVDNSILSGDQRNVVIEFDYFDDSNQYMTADGNSISLYYLKYNDGGTPTTGRKYFTTTNTDTWKTATITLDDAQFTHNGGINDNNGQLFDFQIGMELGRGGFACRNIKVYVPAPEVIDTDEISAEVNADGTALEGALVLSSSFAYGSTASYDKNVLLSGTDGRSAVDGKHYLFNQEYTAFPSNKEWQRWKNGFYFKIPDSFAYGNTYGDIEIEVEYYAPSGQIELLMKDSTGADKSVGKTAVVANQWTTKKYIISEDDGRNLVLQNSLSGCDFRFNFDCQAYIHKVTVKKLSNIKNIGVLRGWQPHVTADGRYMSLTDDTHVIIYDIEQHRLGNTSNPDHPDYQSNHVMINPIYPNLVLFAHEGDAGTTFDRMWTYNTVTGKFNNVFKQYSNLDGSTTGEAVGHENWTADGEKIVAVKYKHDENIGRSGIVRIDKDGNNREYLNGDHDYWHCHPSPDGRWIVADTKMSLNSYSKIVLIDSKSGKSYVVAKQKVGANDPWQPHAQFSADGTKVTFGMIRRQLNNANVLGVGIVDVSDLVNDGQLGEPADPTDYKISPFEIGFNKDAGRNEVKTRVTNIDGIQRDMNLYAGVFDSQGRLISAGKSRYDSSADGTLTAEIRDTGNGETVKCFMWDDNMDPVSNHVDTVKNIRAAKVGANEVVLSWQDDSDMPAIKYEVFRGGQKIGETPYPVYRDSGLTKETQYTYYIRPVYSGIAIGEDASYASADVDGLDFDGIYSVLERPCKNYGLTFLENDNLAFDSYTEFKVKDGESCRMARQVLEGEEDGRGNKRWGSTYDGMFYFDCDRGVITADTNNVLIGVRYYDNREGVNLSIDYKKADGTVGSKTVVTKTGTDTWKTATVLLDDAKFVDSSEINGHDFRFQGGYSMYISRVWAIPLDQNGNRISRGGSGSPIVGGQAGVKVTTRGETVSATLVGNEITENGLHFTLNGSDNSVDGYTEATNEGGRDCRQNTSASTSMFCFKVNKDIIPEDVTAIDVTVEYYGYNYNGGKIQLKYTATDGTTKTVDVASPSSSSWSSSAKQWKTATVSITDAKLIGGLNRGSDLVIKPTGKSTKIYSVTVTKKSTPAASPLQYIEWNASTDAGSGLSRISGGQISGDDIYVHSVNDWLKFSVNDLYLYGKSNNAVWVDITYRDSGTSNIYLYYNTSDPTVAAPKADKLAETVITCEGTGLYKTVSIPLIDANFSNYDGYDFRIVSDNGAYIKNVRVVGY